jgi:hypothetical protein
MTRILIIVFAALWIGGCSTSSDDSPVSGTAIVPGVSAPVNGAPPRFPDQPSNAARNSGRLPSEPFTFGDRQPESELKSIAFGEQAEQAPRETPTGTTDEGNVSLAPDVWDPSAFVRPLRRLNIDQLDAALARATGIPMITRLASGNYRGLFGKPDYLTSNQEDLRPGVVFTKLYQDLVYHQCWKTVYDEWRGRVSEPVFFADMAVPSPIIEADSRANLAYLLLRWHSIDVAPDSAEVDKWYQLLNQLDAANGGNTEEAWQGVCVSLALHPRFYTL